MTTMNEIYLDRQTETRPEGESNLRQSILPVLSVLEIISREFPTPDYPLSGLGSGLGYAAIREVARYTGLQL